MPLSSSSCTSPPSLISYTASYTARFPWPHGVGRSALTSRWRWVVRSLRASSDTDAKLVSLRCSRLWGPRGGKRSGSNEHRSTTAWCGC
jgi:hypothetical protein